MKTLLVNAIQHTMISGHANFDVIILFERDQHKQGYQIKPHNQQSACVTNPTEYDFIFSHFKLYPIIGKSSMSVV